MTVDVYTPGPGCQGCKATKRRLNDKEILYTEHPLDGVADIIEQHHFTTAPVVHVRTDDGEHLYWDGYRPDRIDALVMP